MPCVCDTFPGNLRGYVKKEQLHPPGKSTRHMHINLRSTRLYRVEWGTDKGGERFINVQSGKEGDERFAREIARWVDDMFDELSDAYDKAVRGLKFTKVKWTN